MPFLMTSAAGFVASVAVHGLALAGRTPPGGDAAMIVLHVGIFPGFFAAILATNRRHGPDLRGRSDFWKVALAPCPRWTRSLFYMLFAYTIVNFVVTIATERFPQQGPAAPGPTAYRLFSGHWMVFHFTAAALLYAAIVADRPKPRAADPPLDLLDDEIP